MRELTRAILLLRVCACLLLAAAAVLPSAARQAGARQAGAQTVPADREALLKAEESGQAATAEANGYPGPKNVLAHARDLALTPEQVKSIGAVQSGLEQRARELAARIIRIEGELNEAFRTGLIAEGSVKDDAEQIGRLRGRLRGAFLAANLRTKALLTPKQLELYRKIAAAAAAGKK